MKRLLVLSILLLLVSCNDDYIIYYGCCPRDCKHNHKKHYHKDGTSDGHSEFEAEDWKDDTKQE